MTRDKAKQLLPILQAFVEGKDIEFRRNSNGNKSLWYDIRDEINLECSSDYEFRINTPPIYRPFANVEECWKEMLKHQPFGWLKDKEDGHCALLTSVDNGDLCAINGYKGWNFNGIRECFTFADGATFGIKGMED